LPLVEVVVKYGDAERAVIHLGEHGSGHRRAKAEGGVDPVRRGDSVEGCKKFVKDSMPAETIFETTIVETLAYTSAPT
jgi:hypothetical protein